MSKLNLIPIGTLFDLEKGSLQSSKCTEGEYTFITAAQEWKTHNEYSHECEALIFAAAASGSLGRTHYINDKFITSDLCFILTPKDAKKYPINLKFYHFVFNSLKDEIVKNTKSGTSKESINQSNLRNYEIPYFEIDKQNLWIDKLVNTKSIKEDLESETSTQQSLLKQLKQTILQEAIEGKLTAKWRVKNPAIGTARELLEDIKKEKEKLVKEKKIKPSKPLAPINEDEIPFDIPQSWEWCRLGEIGNAIRGKSPEYANNTTTQTICLNQKCIRWGFVKLEHAKKVQENWYQSLDKSILTKSNDILVNSTGDGTIGRSAIVDENSTEMIFDSHVLLFRSLIANQLYFLYAINSDFGQNQINDLKGAKSTKQTELGVDKLSSLIFPLPPLEEQKEIVTTIEKLFTICDELTSEINQNKTIVESLMATVIKEAFEK